MRTVFFTFSLCFLISFSAIADTACQQKLDAGIQEVVQKNGQAAIDLLNQVVDCDLSPQEKAKGYFYRAQANKLDDNKKATLKDLNKAIKLDPKLAAAYYMRGKIFHANRRYKKAKKDYIHTLELEPKNGGVHYRLALVLMELGEHETARREYKILNSLNPERAEKLLEEIPK